MRSDLWRRNIYLVHTEPAEAVNRGSICGQSSTADALANNRSTVHVRKSY